MPFVVHNLFRDPLRRTLKVCARRTLHLFAFRARPGEDLFRLLTGALLGLRHQLPRLHVGVAAAVLDLSGSGALLNGDAADAAAVKAEQVKDSKTVESLGKELKASAPEYEGCVADGKDGLETAIDELDDAAAWYEKHTGSLKKAVDAVNDSKLAKTIDTAKTLLESSNGNVQDDKTREELSKAIEAKDEAAIAKASKAVNDSIAAKRKADEEAKAKAQAEADAKAAEEAAAAANAQTQQQQYNYQQSQPQQSWTPSYPYGGGSTGGGSGTTGGSTGGSAGSSYGGSFGYSSSDNFGGARPGGTCPESVCGV